MVIPAGQSSRLGLVLRFKDMDKKKLEQTKWGWVILFFSTGTLLCCALPILLVTLGAGAVVATVAANIPFLVALSLYKSWMFLFSGILLLFGGWLLYRPSRTCPTTPELAELCTKAYHWNHRLYWISVGIWNTGFFFFFIF